MARELFDGGEVDRLAGLCLRQLAEQWQAELHDKFHVDAVLVLSSTASRLERNCRLGQSLFDLIDRISPAAPAVIDASALTSLAGEPDLLAGLLLFLALMVVGKWALGYVAARAVGLQHRDAHAIGVW